MNPVRKMMTAFMAVALLCVFAQVSSADYSYRNGYWWSGGQAFTRQKVYINPYTSCGRTYYANYYWKYTPVAGVTQGSAGYNSGSVSSSEDNWRARLLDIAKQRDQYEYKARTSALEHNEFLEALDALGMKGNFGPLQNYGYAPGYAHITRNYSDVAGFQNYAQGYVQQAGAQGSTVYGYSAAADIYGDVDLGALYQAALRLAEQSNDYGAQATTNAQALVKQEGHNQARVAEILARGQVASQLMESTRPGPEAHIQLNGNKSSVSAGGGSSGSGSGGPSIQSNTAPLDLGTVITQKCLKCHGGDKVEGNLNFTDLSKIDGAMGREILARIISTDAETRMPPTEPLAPEEIMLFFQSMDPALISGQD